MERKIDKLVIDTGAFVSRIPIWEYADEYYTVTEVVNEVKDRQSKMFMKFLPVDLIILEPSSSAINTVVNFTKKSGDYASLSSADLKILALTYDLEVRAKGGSSHVRTEPIDNRTEQYVSPRCPDSEAPAFREGFYLPHKNDKKHYSDESSSNRQYSVQSLNIEPVVTDKSEAKFQFKLETSETTTVLTDVHITMLNNHLLHNTYIAGYSLSSYDAVVILALRNSFDTLKQFSDIFECHTKAGNTKILFVLIRRLLQEHRENSQESSELQTDPPSEYQNDLTRNAALKFVQEFSTWTNFSRWFWHVLTLQFSTQQTDFAWFYNNLPDVREVISHILECSEEDAYDVSEKGREAADFTDEEKFGIEGQNATDEDYASYESGDDDDDWITPSNIKDIRRRYANPDGQTPENVHVACITVDYSMQNTLKHLGLSVVGVDGRLINHLRTFIFRCYACFKTTDKMDLVFCPRCGNKTLKRVSVSMNPDGTQKIWISNRKPISTRGMRFSLPKPQGGKHGVNPIVVADQRLPQQKPSRASRMTTNAFDDGFDDRTGGNPFITRDVYSRSAQLGIRSWIKSHSGTYHWEQKNPNENRRKASRRKK